MEYGSHEIPFYYPLFVCHTMFRNDDLFLFFVFLQRHDALLYSSFDLRNPQTW